MRLRRSRAEEKKEYAPKGPGGYWSLMKRRGRDCYRPHSLNEIFLEDHFEQEVVSSEGLISIVPVWVFGSGPSNILFVVLGEKVKYFVRRPTKGYSPEDDTFLSDWRAKKLSIAEDTNYFFVGPGR